MFVFVSLKDLKHLSKAACEAAGDPEIKELAFNGSHSEVFRLANRKPTTHKLRRQIH
jgi:hypothetical protein